MERRWIIVIISGAVILSTLVIGLVIHASFDRDSCKETVCQTSECVQVAAQILNYIDLDADPCENFYTFACGNFLANIDIPIDMHEISTDTLINDDLQTQLKAALEEDIENSDIEPITTAKIYYQSCINSEAIERKELRVVRRVLKDMGGWPVLEQTIWERKNLDWYYYIYKFRQLGLSTDYIIQLKVAHDFKNSTFHMLELDQPLLSLPREFYLEDFENPYIEEYRRYMVNVAVYLGADDFRATTELRDALKFEAKLAKISASKEDHSNISNYYNTKTIKELEELYPTIPWLEYINNLISPHIQVTPHERILVLIPSYFKELEVLLQKTPERVVINYLVWRTISSIIPYLTSELREMELIYQSFMFGVEQSLARWKECVIEVYKRLPVVVSAIYIRKYSVEEAKDFVTEMMENIKDEYVSSIGKLDWMDKETKKSAIDKAEALDEVIGYSEELLYDEKLEEIYNGMEVNPKEYLQSFLNISIKMENLKFKHLRVLKKKTAWIHHSTIAETRPFYNILTNTITIPAGIFQGIFYNTKHPNYLNYGGIGFAIGQQITHAFDDTGRQFDKDGNLEDWWESNTEEKFLEKTECLVDQYDSYEIAELNQTVNGGKTLGDNIADLGGIKHAYAAYIKWAQRNGNEKFLPGLGFSPAQLFWISYALNHCSKIRPEYLQMEITTNVHAPPEFRVLGPLNNFEEFAEDFDCPPDSDMYPADSCSIW